MFLSYARKDGEEFASALRQRLTEREPELSVWQDRSTLEGGIGWWRQIETALDRARFMIAVMTPAAIRSDVTRQEWRYARQRGVIVYPVKGVPDAQLDYQALPRWMRKSHFFDLGRYDKGEWQDVKEWDTFVNYLKSDRSAVRVPFMAPALADGFVARETEYRRILDLIIGSPREEPIALTTALHGAGGYGKTTLATAICHDPRVIETFDDGILWTSLGQTPNVMLELVKLYDSLTGETIHFVDLAHAAGRLRDRLAQRNCLLVIDDVWDSSHAEPFLQGGAGCTRLVTTRFADLLPRAVPVNVDEMSREESRKVLAAGFGDTRPMDAALDALAGRLGEWPLLLQLASGIIRRRLALGDSCEGAMRYVGKALDKRGVTAFDQTDAVAREKAVARTLGASIDQLTPADRRQLTAVAIFPEDVEVPLTTVSQLWGLDDIDTEDCCQRLHHASLLILDLRTVTIRLHDVMRSYLLRSLDDAEAVHAQLLARYNDFSELPDSYAWRWLSYHLVAAGMHDQLRALLLDVRWLDAKLAAAGLESLLVDFARFTADTAVEDTDIEVVRGAILLSADVLIAAPGQLLRQLMGRVPADFSLALDRLRADAFASQPPATLCFRHPSLVAPGSLLVQTLTLQETEVSGAAALSGDRVLIWSNRQRHDYSFEGSLRLLNLRTRHHSLVGRTGYIADVVLTDVEEAFSWGDEFRVWNLVTGHSRLLCTRHPDGTSTFYSETGTETAPYSYVSTVSLLPNGALLCSGRTLYELIPSTGERRILADSHTGEPIVAGGSILFWTDGTESADYDWRFPTVLLHSRNLSTGNTRVVATCAESMHGISLPDGCVLLPSREDVLHLWNSGTGLTDVHRRPVSVGEEHTGDFQGVATGEIKFFSNSERAAGALLVPPNRLMRWFNETVGLWNLVTGEYRELARGTPITHAIRLPSGHVVSWRETWRESAEMRVWNLDTGTSFVLRGDQTGFGGAIPLREDRMLSWSGGTLRVWSVSNRSVDAATAHSAAVEGLVALRGGDALSWAGAETALWWHDRHTGKVRFLDGHSSGIRGARRLSTGALVSWGNDGSLQLWDLQTSISRPLRAHYLRVNGALELKDGRLITWSADNDLMLHDLVDSARVLAGHWRDVNGALELWDGSIVSWSDDYSIRWWNLTTGESRDFIGMSTEVQGVIQIGPADVLVWDRAGELWCWHLLENHGAKWMDENEGAVKGATVIDARHVATWGSALRLWNIATGEGRHLSDREAADGALVLGDNGSLLSWGRAPTISVYRTLDSNPQILAGHDAAVSGVTQMDANRIASWSLDHSVAIWDASSGRLVDRCSFDDRPAVVCVDGTDHLVVGDAGGRVHFLEIV